MSKRNENRPGYKKTKVGWIPEEWKCLPLKALCLKTGEYGANASAIPYSKEHPRYIRITDITEDGRLNNDNMKSIDSKRSNNYILNEGDFLFARSGATVGKAYLHVSNGQKYAFAGYLIRFVPNPKKLLGNYLKAFTSTPRYWYWVQTTIRAGAQPNINATEYSLLNIPLPPFPEQKKIAEILSAWDRAIEQVGKLIDAKQRLKKGLMQQLLTGRMRFPEFRSATERVKTHFYDLPLDWKHPRISEIAREVSEKNMEQIDYPVLSCSKYDGFVNSLEYFGKKVYSDDTSNYKIIKRGQFGFPSNHIEEGSIGLLNHVDAGIVSPIYTVFEINPEKVFAPYLYALFKTDTYQHVFRVNTNSSVDRRGSLRWQEFSKIRVPLPSLAEQTRIASVLSICDQEIELLKKKQKKLKEQKKGLMQKLLTGEIRHPQFLKEGHS